VPAIFNVTTNADAGPGSLRQAIIQAEAGTGGDSIFWAPSLTGQTISLATALPTLTKGETIAQAPEPAGQPPTVIRGTSLTVAGNNTFRIFTANSTTMVSISGLTITGGNSGATNGGGVLNTGLLTLANDVLTANSAPTGFGGGVASVGAAAQLTLTNDTISSNQASRGGGVYNEAGTATVTGTTVSGNLVNVANFDGGGVANSGTMTLTKSTVANNSAIGTNVFGGGLENLGGGTLTLNSSTVSNNVAQGKGGGIRSIGTALTLVNSTVANNVSFTGTGGGISIGAGTLTANDSTITGNIDSSTTTPAGGINLEAGTLTFNNTVVAQNITGNGTAPDVRGAATGSNNLIGAGDGALTGLTNGTGGNQVGTTAAPIDPQLGPLQNNGGPTLTRAPLPGSPVIDKGSNAAVPSGTTTDQRGFNRVVNTTVDIGAVEFQPPTTTTTLTINPNPSTFGQPVTFTAQVAGTAPGSNTPTGTVTFMSGTAFVGSTTVDATGKATLTTAILPRGTNPVTATYSGDANFRSSVSPAVTEKVFLQYTPGVFDPTTATWYLRNSNTAGAPDIGPFTYGAPGWTPVVGDWNGDGTVTVGVVDPKTMTWYLRNENSSGVPDVAAPFQFGLPGWIPVAGDWDGTGSWGIGAFDPSTGTWFLRNEAGPGGPDAGTFVYGAPGWTPVVGDWDGNGTFTVGVVNPNGPAVVGAPGGTLQWFLRNSNTAGAPDIGPFSYGLSGWKPITGDWTGQGITTIGAVDPSNNNWFLRNSNTPGGPDITPFAYGAAGWTPVTGDWIKPAPTTTAAVASSGVSSSLPANLLVTGLRRTQALDQVFASGSLGAG
jgi:hypothetical protein